MKKDPARNSCSQPFEALSVAQEFDHLAELLLRLVETRDVVPRDLDLLPTHDRRRLRAGHELERVEQQDDDDPEEHDRQPGKKRVLEIHRFDVSAARDAV